MGRQCDRGTQWTVRWTTGLRATVTRRPVVESVDATSDRLYWTLLSYGLQGMPQAHCMWMWESRAGVLLTGQCVTVAFDSATLCIELCDQSEIGYKHNDSVHKLQCHLHCQAREQSNSAISGKSRCRRLQFVPTTCWHARRRDGCQVTSLLWLVLLQATSESYLPLHHKHTMQLEQY